MKWGKVCLAFGVYKLIVFSIAVFGLAAVAKIWPNSFEHFALLLIEWDAKHILRVASQGYLAQEPSIQVLPVFPLLIRIFHILLPSWNVAAFWAAQFASFFSFYYFYRLVRLDLSEEQSRVALAMFAVFPTAYFLSVPYSETVFCAASFATMYYLRTKKHAEGALAGFLAATSRVIGITLIPTVLIYLWCSRKKLKRKDLIGGLAIAAGTTLGYVAYLALNKYLYGDWFHFQKSLSKNWGVYSSYPFAGAVDALQRWGGYTADQKMSVVIIEIGAVLLALFSLVPLIRQRKYAEATYVGAWLAILLPMSFWLSRPRYVLPLYPMFLVAAPWFTNAPLRLSLYTLASGALFAIYFAVYLNAQWAF